MYGEPLDYRMARTWVIVLFCWTFWNLKAVVCSELNDTEKGLFPIIFNLATNALIIANATCGVMGPELYCKLVEHVLMKKPQCGICNANSTHSDERHPIENAIDGTNRWWQSPSLANGERFRYVTITLDLRQVYQVAYVIIKAANSPRPGNWILERSLDGIHYKPWQYYVISDSDCYEKYGILPTIGKPRYRTDDEVICTSSYANIEHLEDGEILTSLVNGRPGIKGPSNILREFTTARFVRLRLQNIRTLKAELMGSEIISEDLNKIDKSVARRLFYSIKDISIGGQCICYGHAKDCIPDKPNENLRCICQHNTCGESCEQCCPLFNQKPWKPGTSEDAAVCELCECFNHADECVYDEKVASAKTSLSPQGKYEGGGRCLNCKHNTMGINCEQCLDGFYRPQNVDHSDRNACRPCRCKGVGTIGHCVKDTSQPTDKQLFPGDCICREGFAGKQCDRCATGYRNYPVCDRCPCNIAGTVNIENCEGKCICKPNVEGYRCDKCKLGYFNLDINNPLGCTECFCFGITRKCTETNWSTYLINEMRGWKITTFDGSQSVSAITENKTVFITDSDVETYRKYFWSAPKEYLGNKLVAYGGKLQYVVTYSHYSRDTGDFIPDADIILEGNGIRIGHKEPSDKRNKSIMMTMTEDGWLKVDDDGQFLSRIHKKDFMTVLVNIKRLLIKAKYYNHQREASLSSVFLEVASKTSVSGKKNPLVEQCRCPRGYFGLSCESCLQGYRRKNELLYEGQCLQCECHGYSEVCDPYSGQCLNCLHNTAGISCDQCAQGYYIHGVFGSSDMCKRCACPLSIPSNNFSPTCTLSPIGQDFMCTACPSGYSGSKCEECADGYFGQPHVPGNYCQPCMCSGNIDIVSIGNCDRKTGQCLKCIANTGGWNCERCKDGYWGNALLQECKECECNLYGSITVQCDQKTGTCSCKPNYIGAKCDACALGFGNVAAGCPICNCNKTGSISSLCDVVSGMCNCKLGISGSRCDSCAETYFGFSSNGCKRCNCDLLGSYNSSCHQITGQCYCKPNIVTRTCSTCKEGFYNFASNEGCKSCDCHPTGSTSQVCDSSGNCVCKSGVGKPKCNECLPGFFGFSYNGCTECLKCEAPGQVCDPQTGDCICPTLTTGRRCERCEAHAWNYDPLSGCQLCDCDIYGSLRVSCHPDTGQCKCKEGFEGLKCNQCRYGFYNFPQCQSCNCVSAGSRLSQCNAVEVCQCNNDGQCFCKENVEGKHCHQCKEGSFSLSYSNPLGCTKCFCFGRSNNCRQAPYVWDKIIGDDQDVSFKRGTTYFETVQGLRIIPETEVVSLSTRDSIPLYWRLPKEFLGDKVTSYNGTLSFTIHNDYSRPYSVEDELQYPLVQIQGNFRIVLEYYIKDWPTNNVFNIHLHESFWKIKMNDDLPVSRERLMIALQNLQHIFVRATRGSHVNRASLTDIRMAIARPGDIRSGNLAIGVEFCECPAIYQGFSCQDPSDGYWRKKKPDYLDSKDLIDLIGEAALCSCHLHSNNCDKETGICMDCQHNTFGEYCEFCLAGFYGEPEKDGLDACKPCRCPLLENSFSPTCLSDGANGYYCDKCERGYRGRHCEECDERYFGNPTKLGGKCNPCNCNVQGSRSLICDRKTGQCICREGLFGQDCSQCKPGFVITETGACISCIDDNCTGLLLSDITRITLTFNQLNTSNIRPVPWNKLWAITKEYEKYKLKLNSYVNFGENLFHLYPSIDVPERNASLLLYQAIASSMRASNINQRVLPIKNNASVIIHDLQDVFNSIKVTTKNLSIFLDPSEPHRQPVDISLAIREAERILRDIKRRKFDFPEGRAEEELGLAKDLLARVLQKIIGLKKIDEIENRTRDLKAKIHDLNKIINEKIEKLYDDVHSKNTWNDHRIQKMNNVRLNVTQLGGKIDNQFSNSMNLLDLAKEYLEEPRSYRNNWQKIANDLNDALDSLDKIEGNLGIMNSDYKMKWVIPAVEHADRLTKQADELFALANSIQNVTADPLRAAQVYDKIVFAINEAEAAAHSAQNAVENAYDQASFGKEDPLLEKARESKHLSGQLNSSAHSTASRIPSLAINLRQTAVMTRFVDNSITSGYKQLSELNFQPYDVQYALRNTTKSLNRTEEIIRNIFEIIKSKSDITQKFDATSGFKDLSDTLRLVNVSKSAIKSIQQLADRYENKVKNISNLNTKINDNLEALRAKILTARQTASMIRVSLSVNGTQGCVRSYKSNLQPSTRNTIELIYATETPEKNSLLLYIAHPSLMDFIAVEVVNRTIRFVSNAGGGTTVIQNPLVLEKFDPRSASDDLWYKIEIERIGEVINLKVKSNKKGSKDNEKIVTTVSVDGFSRMDLDPSSYLYVGGVPESIKIDKEVLTRTFSGCLFSIVIDNNILGLWNFLTNTGCQGCTESSFSEEGYEYLQFNGNGYAIQPQVKQYSNNKYEILLEFRTFDEDCLLIFIPNEQEKDFVAIYLKGGQLYYQFDLGSNSLSINTDKKYNTGQWFRVKGYRDGLDGALRVNRLDVHLETKTNSASKHSKSSLELKHALLYIGGLPPGFNMTPWEKFGISTKGLLGCMKPPEIEIKNLDLFNNKYFGIEKGCKLEIIRDVALDGNGYLELKSFPLSTKSSLSFSFSTTQKNALLLLSTFMGKSEEATKADHFYSIALEDGNLVAQFNNGGTRERIKNSTFFNDGLLHTVSINRDKKRITVDIDDETIGHIRLSQAKPIQAPTDGGLFLGGVKSGLHISDQVPVFQGLKGCIRDAIVNQQLLNLTDFVAFNKVSFGRCSLFQVSLPPPISTVTSVSQVTESFDHSELQPSSISLPLTSASHQRNKNRQQCAEEKTYPFEEEALSFGDDPNSYAHITDINRKIFNKNFQIIFDFRTFYSTGLIAYAANKAFTNSLTIALSNGQILVNIQTRVSHGDIYSEGGLNDGTWKTVNITRNGPSLHISVNGHIFSKNLFTMRNGNTRKLPKLLVNKPLYIAGLPNRPKLRDEVNRENFKGCIRKFTLNKDRIDLSTVPSVNVSHCFSKIQAGIYFPGNAYAIIEENYNVGSKMDINVEFRTHKPNGIILSISEKRKPALGLELKDGKLIFSVDEFGIREKFNVTKEIRGEPYRLCDGNWHTVIAAFIKNVITLKIDNEEVEFGHTEDILQEIKTNTSLYIGGFPDHAKPQGGVSGTEKFHGCLKNLAINDQRVIWSNKMKLHNVHLNSCPSD